MAKQPGYQSRSTNSGTGELKSRLLFVLGALIVYRIGSFIPLPGIDAAVLAQLVEQQKGTIIDMLNMFSGGALSRASILALGIMPYISASIVMQLLATVSPALAELKKKVQQDKEKSPSILVMLRWFLLLSKLSQFLPVYRICCHN